MKRPEEALQRAAVTYLRLLEKRGKLLFYHPPNGGRRSKSEGARFKAAGVKPGVSDLAFVLPGGQAAFIELKAPGGRLSPSQKDFIERVEGFGAWTAVCDSLEQVAGRLARWL
jgi:hypothetical protein